MKKISITLSSNLTKTGKPKKNSGSFEIWQEKLHLKLKPVLDNEYETSELGRVYKIHLLDCSYLDKKLIQILADCPEFKSLDFIKGDCILQFKLPETVH